MKKIVISARKSTIGVWMGWIELLSALKLCALEHARLVNLKIGTVFALLLRRFPRTGFTGVIVSYDFDSPMPTWGKKTGNTFIISRNGVPVQEACHHYPE